MTTEGIWKFFLKIKRFEIKYTVATRLYLYFQPSLNPYISQFDVKSILHIHCTRYFILFDITLTW
jgi:hypothetical protein